MCSVSAVDKWYICSNSIFIATVVIPVHIDEIFILNQAPKCYSCFNDAQFKLFAAVTWIQAIMNVPFNMDGLMQEGRNSIALAMELRPSCINPSIWYVIFQHTA